MPRRTPSPPVPEAAGRQWHRLFGLLLTDHLAGSPFTVELEKDLSRKMFSAAPEQVQYGAEHYRVQSADTTTLVNQLFEEYRSEGLAMAYTMEDFRRDVARKYLDRLTPEERLAGLRPEERLAGLLPEDLEAYLKAMRKRPARGRKEGSPVVRKRRRRPE